ncbi:MAG TPA: acetylxylan esterase [Tepidisphaeraceae bacterium]|jgi:cephalosporin-C deacetylase-like acetyl esterase|nr:acetylxylan esterase [Tepidisphaeraceae bacterium]
MAASARSIARLFCLLGVSFFGTSAVWAQQWVVTPSHADGIYKVGEPIEWSVQWKGDGAPASVNYDIKKGDLNEIANGSVTLSNGAGKIESKLDQPGTLFLEVKSKAADGKDLRGLGGAVAAPGEIKPAAKRPDDFDAFWASKIDELQAVPPDPKLESVDSGKAGVQYWHITMNNIRGTHIQGQLARPEKGDKFPALLIVQWAGVYGLQKPWVTDRASDGWLVLNIEPHDLPIDKPEAFYKEQFDGPLKNYWAIGNDDREKSYFLRMYLSCYRAAEYLAQRPDWDGKVLVVNGGSQGGLQALMVAGIELKITACTAIVPAGCDMRGPEAGCQPGWPQWYFKTDGKDADKVHRASEYYDVANFVSRIKCPVLVGLGLIDEICPPEATLATMSQITAPKEIIILPYGDHPNTNNSHEPYTKRCWNAWLPDLVHDKPAPVQAGSF